MFNLPPPDTDGLVDMRPICGITVARRKGKPGKEDKVSEINKTTKAIHTICLEVFPFDCNSWSISCSYLTCALFMTLVDAI